MSANHIRKAGILLGQVIGTKMKKTAKVRVEMLVLDKYVMQYFPKRTNVFAHDPNEAAKVGDVVLVKRLPLQRSKHVKFDMDRIVYSQGNVTDPITGQKCDGYAFWDNDNAERDSSDGLVLEDEESLRQDQNISES